MRARRARSSTTRDRPRLGPARPQHAQADGAVGRPRLQGAGHLLRHVQLPDQGGARRHALGGAPHGGRPGLCEPTRATTSTASTAAARPRSARELGRIHRDGRHPRNLDAEALRAWEPDASDGAAPIHAASRRSPYDAIAAQKLTSGLADGLTPVQRCVVDVEEGTASIDLVNIGGGRLHGEAQREREPRRDRRAGAESLMILKAPAGPEITAGPLQRRAPAVAPRSGTSQDRWGTCEGREGGRTGTGGRARTAHA